MKYLIIFFLNLTCFLSFADTDIELNEVKVVNPFVSVCDRSEMVSYEITRQLKYINEGPEVTCDQVTAKDLGKLKRFSVTFLRTEMKPFDLQGLVNVKSLLFDGNHFTSLPEGVLDDLHNLEYIEFIFHYDLKTLPANFLKNQKKLKRFFIGKHSIENWPAEFFDYNPELEKIEIQDGFGDASVFDPYVITPAKLPKLKYLNICEQHHSEESMSWIKKMFEGTNVKIEYRGKFGAQSEDEEVGCSPIA